MVLVPGATGALVVPMRVTSEPAAGPIPHPRRHPPPPPSLPQPPELRVDSGIAEAPAADPPRFRSFGDVRRGMPHGRGRSVMEARDTSPAKPACSLPADSVVGGEHQQRFQAIADHAPVMIWIDGA